MQPFYAGEAARRLFALFDAASTAVDGRPGPAVLICAPHGQEGLRAHRLLRVLAQRLSRSGCDVLRFDPYGSGDSAGADEDLDWDGWVDDIGVAAAELARRCPGRPQVWIGVRLGASVACSAAGRAASAAASGSRGPAVRPAALVLCEPVLDGPAYLRSLALATVQALEASCSIREPAWRATLRDEPVVLEREAVGFALGEALHEALRALSPVTLARPGVARIAVVAPKHDAALAALARDWRVSGHEVTLEVLPYRFDWTAEEALNTALVPPELVGRLAALAGDTAAPAPAR